MSNRFEGPFDDMNQIKDEISPQGVKRNNNKFKSAVHKGNSGMNMLDDKQSNPQNDSTIHQGRKKAYKKNYSNSKGPNDDFDTQTPKNQKKKPKDTYQDYNYIQSQNTPNSNENSQNIFNEQNQRKNMYSNNPSKHFTKKGNNYTQQQPTANNQNNGQSGSNSIGQTASNRMNNPYAFQYQNEQNKQFSQSNPPQSKQLNQMYNPQNQPQIITQSNNQLKQKNQKNQPPIMLQNQNSLYSNQENIVSQNEQKKQIENDMSGMRTNSEESNNDNATITQSQSIQERGISDDGMDSLSTKFSMTGSSNMNNQYKPYMYPNHANQFSQPPMGMYGMPNIQMIMEQQNRQMFDHNIVSNNFAGNQLIPGYSFNMSEEGMKIHPKKMGNKMGGMKPSSETPPHGIGNMNPNMLAGGINLNFPMGNLPQSTQGNKMFTHQQNHPMMNTGSLNSKGSLSMQGNKNTIPNCNNPNINLHFTAMAQSPQNNRNIMPNLLNSNQNLSYSMAMNRSNMNNLNNLNSMNNLNNMNALANMNTMGMNIPNIPTKFFTNTNQVGNNHNQNSQTMGKKHNPNSFRTINSEKSLSASVVGINQNIQGNSNNNNNQNMGKGQYQKFYNSNQNMVNNQQRIYNQNPYQQGNGNKTMNSGGFNANIGQGSNSIEQNRSKHVSVYIKLKNTQGKEDIYELKANDDKNALENIMIKNSGISKEMAKLITKKIGFAMDKSKSVLNAPITGYTYKQFSEIKNFIFREREKKKNEEYLDKSNSVSDLKQQFEKFSNDIKPNCREVKESDKLNITM